MNAAVQAGQLRRIGLTGGIGSGKSTVAALLRDCGAAVIDSDALAHTLTAPGGAALPAIAARFGSDVIGHDGAMDRARMREKVFADPATRQALEGILHPMIAQATQRAAEAVPEGQPIVFDVPLLVESRQWPGRVRPGAAGGLRPTGPARAADAARRPHRRAGAQHAGGSGRARRAPGRGR
jgi:dephospho-CoA kinase